MFRKRSLPISSTKAYTTTLNNARLVPFNMNNVMPDMEISKNSPLNPQLNQKVKNNVGISINNKKLAPVKTKDPPTSNTANVALYDIRGEYTTNAENVLGSTIMAQNLINNKRERIQLETDARDYAYNPSEHVYNVARVGGTGVSLRDDSYHPNQSKANLIETYNPMLPESETNVRPKNLPRIQDERIERRRNEREYLLPSDQATFNLNMLKSEDHKMRQQRQADMYEATHSEHGINRWKNDTGKKFLWSPDAEKQLVDTKQDSQVRHKAITEADEVRGREPFREQDYHAVDRMIEIRRNFDKENVKLTNSMNRDMIRKAKKERFETDEGDQKSAISTDKNVISTVSDAVLNVLGLNSTKENYKPAIQNNRSEGFDAKRQADDLKAFIKNNLMVENFQVMERENHHTKLIMNRDYEKPVVVDVVNEYDNTASSFVTVDANSEHMTRLRRMLTYVQDGKFIVLQQYEQDKWLGGGLNDGSKPEDMDFLITTIPLEELNETFRMKLKELNPLYNERSTNLKLRYEDYVALIDWLEKEPQKCERIQLEQLVDNLRSFDYDRDIKNDYSKNIDMFITLQTQEKLTEDARQRMITKMKGRPQPDRATNEINDNVTEQFTSPRLKTKTISNNYGNVTTTRTQNPNKNRFRGVQYTGL